MCFVLFLNVFPCVAIWGDVARDPFCVVWKDVAHDPFGGMRLFLSVSDLTFEVEFWGGAGGLIQVRSCFATSV
jgi:hypothetical protein